MKLMLSIIIINYNTSNLLKNCLQSIFENLRKEKQLTAEVIVIDNHSQDDSVMVVKKYFPQVKLLTNQVNLGFSGGNNQGIKIARGELILLLNSDTLVFPGALSKMVSFLQKQPQAGIVGAKLLNQNGSGQPSAGSFPNLWVRALMLFREHFFYTPKVRAVLDKIKKADWVMGAAMMIKKEVFEKVGLLDEKIFMYIEEVEFCYRAKKAGYEVFYYPYAKVTHFGQGSSKTGRKEPILNIYKGLLYFYKKHKTKKELILLKILLKTKALIAYLIGVFKRDKYLRETYGQAWQIS